MLSRQRAYSAKIDRALAFAAAAHREQTRKGTSVPYIMHPVHVAMILLKHGFAEDVVIAGLLHDVVEDCAVPIVEIRRAFGARVAKLVAGVTERKTGRGTAKRPWRARKVEQLAHLRRADRDGAALKGADALHNCRTTLAELEAHGTTTWERFAAGPDEQAWYYGSVATLVKARLGDHPLAHELEQAAAALATHAEGAVERAADDGAVGGAAEGGKRSPKRPRRA